MRDIVTSWVILPECKVIYDEKGKGKEEIGFASPATALLQFHSERKRKQDMLDDLEWITKERTISRESEGLHAPVTYQLAFPVRKSGFWPERSFILVERFEMLEDVAPSAVCIEGIRVANSIPGFSNISAVLSVRGNRNLRTTVSRSGLEVDEEYRKTAQICSEMLFEHIKDEINRISKKSGAPLSQASTAAKWLFASLEGSVKSSMLTYLWKQYESLSAIVIERQNADVKTTRTLVSQQDIANEKQFWTVESRLLDSLGTISRDLGRELSLHEFVTGLAPEFKALPYWPLVPDAWAFRDLLTVTHKPQSAEFSRFHQQSAIQWIQRQSLDDNTCIDIFSLFPGYESLGLGISSEMVHIVRGQHSAEAIRKLKFTEIASIKGDDPKVEILNTRTMTIIQPQTVMSKTWLEIRAALIKCAELKVALDEDFQVLISLAVLFGSYIQNDRERYSYDPDNRFNQWPKLATKAESYLQRLGIEVDIPKEINPEATTKIIFDAADYWRDWFRKKEF